MNQFEVATLDRPVPLRPGHASGRGLLECHQTEVRARVSVESLNIHATMSDIELRQSENTS